jgi:hypothetical protein
MEPPNSPAAITHLQKARTLLVEKIDALGVQSSADSVREEYRAAVQELDQLLADRARI